MGANTETHIWNKCRRLETLKHTVPNGASPSNSYHYYLQLIVIQEEKNSFCQLETLQVYKPLLRVGPMPISRWSTKNIIMLLLDDNFLFICCSCCLLRASLDYMKWFLIFFSMCFLSLQMCVSQHLYVFPGLFTPCLLLMPQSAWFCFACILIYVIIMFQMYVCFPMKEKMKL